MFPVMRAVPGSYRTAVAYLDAWGACPGGYVVTCLLGTLSVARLNEQLLVLLPLLIAVLSSVGGCATPGNVTPGPGKRDDASAHRTVPRLARVRLFWPEHCDHKHSRRGEDAAERHGKQRGGGTGVASYTGEIGGEGSGQGKRGVLGGEDPPE